MNSTTVKAKSDPEALLNDLSSSLKSFQSTVSTWTAASELPATNTNTAVSADMRPARLGLGAKPQRNAVAGDSVAGNLALKNQLTGKSSQKHEQKKIQNIPTNSKVSKPTSTKRRTESDDESGGRASLIKNKKK